VYVRFGPTGEPPDRSLFDDPPEDESWTDTLGGQTRLSVGAAQATARVRDAWESVPA
jgi:hypothetical protein